MQFEESSNFTKRVTDLLEDESYAELQVSLMDQPDKGNVIPGTGGLRKIRWAAKGKGKSGGVRVIYYWWKEESGILLADIYPKNEKENLSKAETAELKKLVENWLNEKQSR